MKIINSDDGFAVLNQLFAKIQNNDYVSNQKMLDEAYDSWIKLPEVSLVCSNMLLEIKAYKSMSYNDYMYFVGNIMVKYGVDILPFIQKQNYILANDKNDFDKIKKFTNALKNFVKQNESTFYYVEEDGAYVKTEKLIITDCIDYINFSGVITKGIRKK